MGIAILEGVVASLEARHTDTSGSSNGGQIPTRSSTHLTARDSDALIPSRFIACVNREESVQHLKRTFHGRGNLSEPIKIVAGENVASIRESDVVLLWFVKQKHCFIAVPLTKSNTSPPVASPSRRMLSCPNQD